MNNVIILIIVGAAGMLFFSGIRIVRPTHRGLIERFGKYNRFANPGFHWIIPGIDLMYQVNITEKMINAEPQEIITNDNLNAKVDAQVYFKITNDEDRISDCEPCPHHPA
jgi:regulator of protease activity HflC (stomatin/prohibitin superfamily)